LSTPRDRVEALGNGGLSGEPLRERSLQVLRRLRARVGSQLVLIAAGGISTADDAWQRILAGATLVQIYSALVYEGPGLPNRIARGLLDRLDSTGFASISEAVGKGA
jgi:dihydroorotate dehydrogenase